MKYAFRPGTQSFDLQTKSNYLGELVVYIETISICEYKSYKRAYYIKNNASRYYVYTEQIPEFEELFPVFPYSKYRENKKLKEKALYDRIDKLERNMTIIITHLEALMTVTRLRLPTDDLLCLD